MTNKGRNPASVFNYLMKGYLSKMEAGSF